MLKAVSVVRRLIPVGGGVRRLLGLCHGYCLLTRSWQVLFDGRVSQDSRQWGRSVDRWLDARGKGPDAFSPSDGRIFLGKGYDTTQWTDRLTRRHLGNIGFCHTHWAIAWILYRWPANLGAPDLAEYRQGR